MARIVLARTARRKKLELSSCWHDLHFAWLSESSFTVPRWSDKLLAFVSVALCEVERISESGSVSTQPNDFDFCQQLHASSFGCQCVSSGVCLIDLALKVGLIGQVSLLTTKLPG